MELNNSQIEPNSKSVLTKIKRNSFYTLFFILPKKTILLEIQRIRYIKVFKLIKNFKKLKSSPNSEVCFFKAEYKTGINTVCFSPCKKYFAVSYWEPNCLIYYMDYLKKNEFGKIFMKIGAHNEAIRSICFSDDGKYFATGSYDKSSIIYHFDPNRPNEIGKIFLKFQDHILRIYSIAFSPCSKYFVSGSDDKIAWLYNLESFVFKLKNGDKEFPVIEKTMLFYHHSHSQNTYYTEKMQSNKF